MDTHLEEIADGIYRIDLRADHPDAVHRRPLLRRRTDPRRNDRGRHHRARAGDGGRDGRHRAHPADGTDDTPARRLRLGNAGPHARTDLHRQRREGTARARRRLRRVAQRGAVRSLARRATR